MLSAMVFRGTEDVNKIKDRETYDFEMSKLVITAKNCSFLLLALKLRKCEGGPHKFSTQYEDRVFQNKENNISSFNSSVIMQ
jgi:hypothetical protein